MWGWRGVVGDAFLCNISGELESSRAFVNVCVCASLISRAICTLRTVKTSVLAMEYARDDSLQMPSSPRFLCLLYVMIYIMNARWSWLYLARSSELCSLSEGMQAPCLQQGT